jgi:hypothetical protein
MNCRATASARAGFELSDMSSKALVPVAIDRSNGSTGVSFEPSGLASVIFGSRREHALFARDDE